MTIQGYGHVFARNPLDKGEKERRNESEINNMMANPQSRFLPLRELNLLVNTGPESNLFWLSRVQLDAFGYESEPIFLGILNDVYHFAVEVSIDRFSDAVIRNLKPSLRFIDVRSCGEFLDREEAGIAAQARIQVYWHQRYKFCSACGSKTQMKRAGQVRNCTGCGTDHFPRTDPVIIVVVHDGDKCLLGQSRGRLQRTNTYSALAGFVDQGESIEEAVAREVMEEAGIEVKNVKYHSSQPWPLPYSLMIGCHAEAVTTNINMDEDEMTDVKWFDRRDVISALENDSEVLKVPMKIAIAHHLVKSWALNEI